MGLYRHMIANVYPPPTHTTAGSHRYTITMLPVIEALASGPDNLDLAVLAWALAFGACYGGNGTIIGASANIVTAGLVSVGPAELLSWGSWIRTVWMTYLGAGISGS